MRWSIALWLVLLASSFSQSALAEAPIESAPAPAARYWYGWQTLLADGLGIGALALAVETGSEDLAVLGVASLALTPPIVHAVHGNWLGTGVSLTLRLGGGALVLGAVAIAFANFGEPNSSASGDRAQATFMFSLGLLALLAAPIVDAVLALEPKEEVEARAWSVQPWVAAKGGAAGLSVSGHL